MPGTITHLLVAKKVIDKLERDVIKNHGLFYAGTLAPDAIHAKSDYKREDKKKTHFRSEIRDVNFIEEKNLNIFRGRIKQFTKSYVKKDSSNFDIYLGYLTHIITDELFMLEVRTEFTEKMKKLDIYQHDKEYLEKITFDLHNNDIAIRNECADISQVITELEGVKAFEIKDYLSESHLTISRNWVLNTKLKVKLEHKDSIYVSKKRIEEFVESASTEIINRLRDLGVLEDCNE